MADGDHLNYFCCHSKRRRALALDLSSKPVAVEGVEAAAAKDRCELSCSRQIPLCDAAQTGPDRRRLVEASRQLRPGQKYVILDERPHEFVHGLIPRDALGVVALNRCRSCRSLFRYLAESVSASVLMCEASSYRARPYWRGRYSRSCRDVPRATARIAERSLRAISVTLLHPTKPSTDCMRCRRRSWRSSICAAPIIEVHRPRGGSASEKVVGDRARRCAPRYGQRVKHQ